MKFVEINDLSYKKQTQHFLYLLHNPDQALTIKSTEDSLYLFRVFNQNLVNK